MTTNINYNDNKKITNIQALRGIAVLLVVIYHLTKVEIKYGHGNTIIPSFFSIGMSGVDLFFVISGFVMIFITKGWFRNSNSVRKFIYHRIARIYPMYWIYSLLVLVVFLIKPDMVNSSQGGKVNIIASFLLLPQELLPLLAVGWTLIHEMYFYIVFSIILLFPDKLLASLLFFWGSSVLIMGFAMPSLVNPNPVIQLATNPLTLEFIAGCLIAVAYFNKKYYKFNSFLIITALIWWLAGYAIYIAQGYGLEPVGWSRVLIFGVPSTLLVFAFANIERSSDKKLPYGLVLVGNASFSIYLSHVLVLSTLGRIWGRFTINNIYIDLVVFLLIIMLALIVGFFSYKLLERPLLKLTRRFEKMVM